MDNPNKKSRAMFSVEVDGINYAVSFDRAWIYDGRRATHCYIDVIDGLVVTIWSTGTALCSTSDNFDKNTGRKIALQRALKEAFPDSPDKRKLFWEAYFKTRGKVN